MTKYMPSSWVPRLFEDDLYDAELTVWTVCLPRSVRCELLQRPRLENRPPYNSADDIISLSARNSTGTMIWSWRVSPRAA